MRCNERVKFADLMDTARELGAAGAGHRTLCPARRRRERRRSCIAPPTTARDQSYFLFATTQAQLAYLRFPLGGMEKREVRALAAELGLAVADKPDSQDICFVPDGNYSNIVEKLKPDAARPGEIVDLRGATWSAAMTASSISPSASARVLDFPAMRSRCSWWRSMPQMRASWSGRARRCARAP